MQAKQPGLARRRSRFRQEEANDATTVTSGGFGRSLWRSDSTFDCRRHSLRAVDSAVTHQATRTSAFFSWSTVAAVLTSWMAIVWTLAARGFFAPAAGTMQAFAGGDGRCHYDRTSRRCSYVTHAIQDYHRSHRCGTALVVGCVSGLSRCGVHFPATLVSRLSARVLRTPGRHRRYSDRSVCGTGSYSPTPKLPKSNSARIHGGTLLGSRICLGVVEHTVERRPSISASALSDSNRSALWSSAGVHHPLPSIWQLRRRGRVGSARVGYAHAEMWRTA